MKNLIPFAGKVYRNTLRPYLPRKIGLYNGIPARKPRLFDYVDVDPEWEEELINAIRNRVNSGDTVVVVGAGFGISTVAAANQTGRSGQVIAYEPAAKRFDSATQTLHINQLEDRVDLRNAVVGPEVAVKGSSSNAESYKVSELPECDILVLDCEGAEKSIIRSLEIEPRDIIVETHPDFDSTTKNVKRRLQQQGYSILKTEVDNAQLGIDIVTATR